MQLHPLGIGEHECSVPGHHGLLAEEELRRSRPERIIDIAQQVGHEDVDQMVEHDRREGHSTGGEQSQVSGLQRRMGKQMVSKRQHGPVVVDNVAIPDSLQRARIHRTEGVGHQRLVDLALDIAGRLDRTELRPEKIGAHERLGQGQMPPVCAMQQPKADRAPDLAAKCGHGRRAFHVTARRSLPPQQPFRGPSPLPRSPFLPCPRR